MTAILDATLPGAEGLTITIVYRWAEGRPERFVEIASEFVQLKVDVIFAVGTEACTSAHVRHG